MKRLFLFALIVSLFALGGYHFGAKVCGSMGIGASPMEKEFCARVCARRLELFRLIEKGAGEGEVLAKAEEIGAIETEFEKKAALHLLDTQKKMTPEERSRAFKRLCGGMQCSLGK